MCRLTPLLLPSCLILLLFLLHMYLLLVLCSIPAPSSAPSSVHLPSTTSSSYTLSAPLVNFSLVAPPVRRAWSGTGGHWALMYLTIFACTAPSISAPNMEYRLMLLQASIVVAPVTNRRNLAWRRQIIYSMAIGRTQGAFSRETRRHSTIVCMSIQGGYLLAIHSDQRYSSSQRCYDSEDKRVPQSLRTFASTLTGPPAPPRRRSTT